jgi:hypothetical protein
MNYRDMWLKEVSTETNTAACRAMVSKVPTRDGIRPRE